LVVMANKDVHAAAAADGMDVSADALAKRANRFSAHHHHRGGHNHSSFSTTQYGPGNNSSISGTTPLVSSSDHDRYMGKGLIGGVGRYGSATSAELDETDYEQMTVKGTSKTLEKEYLRLTAPPRPELVRPLAILQQHLKNLKQEYYRLKDDDDVDNEMILEERERTPQSQWSEEKLDKAKPIQEGHPQRRRDYLWFCSQLKAVRQDCTVQRIGSEFAVDVYETHARIALQEGDLNE
jgi:SAC3 family protein LENG8/THP3